MSSAILKLLRSILVSWRHDFQPCATMVWDWMIVGLLLCYMVTMATKMYIAVNSVKLS
jgi:hypothetical protein